MQLFFLGEQITTKIGGKLGQIVRVGRSISGRVETYFYDVRVENKISGRLDNLTMSDFEFIEYEGRFQNTQIQN